MKHVLVFGSGGHSRVVLEAMEQIQEISVLGLVPEEVSVSDPSSFPIFLEDDLNKLWESIVFECFLAVGENLKRQKLFEKVRKILPFAKFSTIIHPAAYVSNRSKIASGTFVAAGATIATHVVIGHHAIINTNASVDHDCTIGDFGFIAPNVGLGGGVDIGNKAFVGIGANVLPGKKIGDKAVVGAGSVVTNDVPNNEKVVGVPARKKHDIKVAGKA